MVTVAVVPGGSEPLSATVPEIPPTEGSVTVGVTPESGTVCDAEVGVADGCAAGAAGAAAPDALGADPPPPQPVKAANRKSAPIRYALEVRYTHGPQPQSLRRFSLPRRGCPTL